VITSLPEQLRAIAHLGPVSAPALTDCWVGVRVTRGMIRAVPSRSNLALAPVGGEQKKHLEKVEGVLAYESDS
jgi:hypothetical protein